MNKNRLYLASMIAPLVPTFLVVLLPALFLGSQAFGNALLMAILLSLITSYLAFFALGVPLLLVLEKKGALSLVGLSTAGAIAGALAFTCMLYIFGSMLESKADVGAIQIIWGAGVGLAVAVVFSLVSGITRRGS
ncbi:hypothetical protein [Microbulbifer sp. ALW1]|uniref:hypothetical protein n=1 Tax=Microbulbifer sp. (strain ALW1) TaxID=1516059 RepID=UPI00135C04ED|nr:hypothetical protein [Microbulbifer sp. ALW1]